MTRFYPWTDGGNGQPVRPFISHEWAVPTVDGDLVVSVEGEQTLTGTTQEVIIDGRRPTPVQLREYIAVLTAALAALEADARIAVSVV